MTTPTVITVTGTLPTESGTIAFYNDTIGRHNLSDSVLLPNKYEATIAGNTFSLPVPASNDPNWSPASWTYHVVIRLTDGDVIQFDCVVPYNAPGATIGLSSLVPATAATGNLYAAYSHGSHILVLGALDSVPPSTPENTVIVRV